MAPTEKKEQVTVRVSPVAQELLGRIAPLWGIAQGDVVEILLRAEWALKGISRGTFEVGGGQKDQVNMRLTPTARRILAWLTEKWEMSQGDAIEVLLRSEDARIGLTKGGLPAVPPPWPGRSK